MKFKMVWAWNCTTTEKQDTETLSHLQRSRHPGTSQRSRWLARGNVLHMNLDMSDIGNLEIEVIRMILRHGYRLSVCTFSLLNEMFVGCFGLEHMFGCGKNKWFLG